MIPWPPAGSSAGAQGSQDPGSSSPETFSTLGTFALGGFGGEARLRKSQTALTVLLSVSERNTMSIPVDQFNVWVLTSNGRAAPLQRREPAEGRRPVWSSQSGFQLSYYYPPSTVPLAIVLSVKGESQVFREKQ